jgi:hypothetical protein
LQIFATANSGRLQQENVRLKKVVANQALDMEILREAAKGNW